MKEEQAVAKLNKPAPVNGYHFQVHTSESGGIGRRAGFRIQWGNPWGFESPLSHLLLTKQLAALVEDSFLVDVRDVMWPYAIRMQQWL